MATGVRSRYHVAIDSKGFMLRGAPMRPRYSKQNAATLLESFRIAHEIGLFDYNQNQFNGSDWLYWTQLDWSGGFQKLKWKDDGSFKDGQAIDPIRKYGQVTLHNGWTSAAAAISGSHSYGAHGVHGTDLLFGTIKNAGAKLFRLTSANVLSTLSAMTTISAVNSITRFNSNSIVGMTRQTAVSASVKTLSKYNGSTVSGFRTANPIVRSVRGVGIRLYTGEKVASLSGDVLYYSTDLSTFTSAYQAGKGRNISKIEDLNGAPYFFIQEGQKVELYRWDEFSSLAYLIYKWDNLTNFGVKNYISNMMITGTSNGKSVAFAFNGARVLQVFDDQLLDTSYDWSKPFEYQGNLQTKGATFDGQNWFPGLYGKVSGAVVTPFVNLNNKPYGYCQPTSAKIILAYQNPNTYNISGFVQSSEFGNEVGAVDKLVNSVDLNFKALTSGQTIEVLRSVDQGATFQSLGTASFTTDGAVTRKTLYYPSGFVTKLWERKVVLVGNGANTPTLLTIADQYRPASDLKRRWTLSLDAGDNIKLLNGQSEQRDGKALMSEIWLAKQAKKTVIYEDVDAFEVELVSAMIKTDTSARVSTTRLMPPKGRMRIRTNNANEEMTYLSADGGVVRGISRGQQRTLARNYSAGVKVDNFYNALVTHVIEQLSDTDEKKTESLAQVILLEA